MLTHYHWDHLQGLPFLAQLYTPGWKPQIFAPILENHDDAWVNTIFQSPFFPVPYEHLPEPAVCRADRRRRDAYRRIRFVSGAAEPPGGALAYRMRGMTGDVVYATDHEFGNPDFDEPLAEFARGAAALILDAHFTPDELPRCTKGGATATGGSARSSRRPTTSAACGCSITSPAEPTKSW